MPLSNCVPRGSVILFIYIVSRATNFFFFWAPVSVGENRGGLDPLPPPNFFLSNLPRVFPYFFAGYSRPKFRFLAPAPHPSDPAPCPFSAKSPPYPRPLNPGPLVLPTYPIRRHIKYCEVSKPWDWLYDLSQLPRGLPHFRAIAQF